MRLFEESKAIALTQQQQIDLIKEYELLLEKEISLKPLHALLSTPEQDLQVNNWILDILSVFALLFDVENDLNHDFTHAAAKRKLTKDSTDFAKLKEYFWSINLFSHPIFGENFKAVSRYFSVEHEIDMVAVSEAYGAKLAALQRRLIAIRDNPVVSTETANPVSIEYIR